MYHAGYVVGAVVAAAVGLASAPARAQEAPTPPIVAVQSIEPVLVAPIAFDRSNRMTLPVRIGNQGPFSFIVDSGSERTVVSNELATQLGLTPAGRARVISMAEVSETNLYRATGLQLNELAIGDRTVPAFVQSNIGAPGLIGIGQPRGTSAGDRFRCRANGYPSRRAGGAAARARVYRS